MATQKPSPFDLYYIPLRTDLIKHVDLYSSKENVGARYNRNRFDPTPSEDNLLYREAEEVKRRFEHLQAISKDKLTFVARHPQCDAPKGYKDGKIEDIVMNGQTVSYNSI
jgi:hypothetical protein